MYDSEQAAVQALTAAVFTAVQQQRQHIQAVVTKSNPADVVSNIDTTIDVLISRTLHRHFPDDIIVTEESSSERWPEVLAGKRGWVVDPICGSLNAARNLPMFTTNISLLEQGKVVAAWVFDHCERRLIGNTNQPLPTLQPHDGVQLIDLNPNTYLLNEPADVRECYAALMNMLQWDKRFSVRNFESSLSFLYVATGQLDGAITTFIKPWDILAACFLVEQAGGVVTYLDGKPWDSQISSAIFARDRVLHEQLLSAILTWYGR